MIKPIMIGAHLKNKIIGELITIIQRLLGKLKNLIRLFKVNSIIWRKECKTLAQNFQNYIIRLIYNTQAPKMLHLGV
jgi:hypothetical protein